jgi:hypothetical protein
MSHFLQGRDKSGTVFRIVSIKGTSDFFTVVDDLRIYAESVLFQILDKTNVFFLSTFGRIVVPATFIKVLNDTIPLDISKTPGIQNRIRKCVDQSVDKKHIDFTLTGHSLGGGLALHLANECGCIFLCVYAHVCDVFVQVSTHSKHDLQRSRLKNVFRCQKHIIFRAKKSAQTSWIWC